MLSKMFVSKLRFSTCIRSSFQYIQPNFIQYNSENTSLINEHDLAANAKRINYQLFKGTC